jgi:hypothetical protein
MVPPDSPTTSTTGGDTGGDISPISGTAPSFPSVYGPPITALQGGLTPGASGSSTSGVVGSGVTAGSIPGGPVIGRVPGIGVPSGPLSTHQRTGRTPDNEDVSKMLSNLGL